MAFAHELGRKRPLGLRRFGVDLVMWRDRRGRAWATRDHCPHRSARLSAGRVRGDEIECPFHGFRFDGQGACTAVPCEGPSAHRAHLHNQAFAVREAHGYLWIWWGDARPSERAVPWFDEIQADMRHAELASTWGTSYQRAVENQLDWAHLPFVHRNSIGAGFPHELEIESEVRDDEIFTWPQHMAQPDGQPGFYLRFKFPNIWINPLGRRAFIVIAFVPVDADQTRIYVRTYQRAVKVPGLSHLYGWLIGRANQFIINQDRRVVATQTLHPDALEHGEKLVPADLPIAQFRKELRRRSTTPVGGGAPSDEAQGSPR